jgi:hypothetical protein
MPPSLGPIGHRPYPAPSRNWHGSCFAPPASRALAIVPVQHLAAAGSQAQAAAGESMRPGAPSGSLHPAGESVATKPSGFTDSQAMAR